MSQFRIAMAQINPIVGDLDGNAKRIIAFASKARRMGADMVVFPELAITGYPPEDLLLKPHFIEAGQKAMAEVAKSSTGICIVCGFADRTDDVYNAAAICHGGKIAAVYRKVYLPNYGVFDENRYFQKGENPLVVELKGVRIGVTICEDIWQPGGPMRDEVLGGDAHVIVNLSSSPYSAGKGKLRQRMLSTRAYDNSVALVYTNLVGGQDELVFDGSSMAFDHEGALLARGKSFQEDLVCVNLEVGQIFRHRLHDLRYRQERGVYRAGGNLAISAVSLKARKSSKAKPELSGDSLAPALPMEQEVYEALVLGTRDYVKKNGFGKVVLGLSGGVDSALTAAIAADAFGPKNVWTVFLPSRFSSDDSYEDAKKLAENLGTRFDVIEIEKTFQSFEQSLASVFKGKKADLTEENIQARTRGTLLMALSNKFGHMVLTTGNKSENSVGYATLYGDMAGGLAVIKDVPKVLVYRLCRMRNEQAGRELIPERILTKAPTAELRDNQKDSDSLPEYDLLDPILRAYVEEDKSASQIAEEGFDRETVDWVLGKVDLSEYKRRQSPPGIKITPRAFGKDRRLPITNRFKDR